MQLPNTPYSLRSATPGHVPTGQRTQHRAVSESNVNHPKGRLAKAALADNIDFSSIKDAIKAYTGGSVTAEQVVKGLMLHGQTLSGLRNNHFLVQGRVGDKMCQLQFELRMDGKGDIFKNKSIGGREVVERVSIPSEELGGIEGEVRLRFINRGMPLELWRKIFSSVDIKQQKKWILSPDSEEIPLPTFLAALSGFQRQELLKDDLSIAKKALSDALAYSYIPQRDENLSEDEVHVRTLHGQFKELAMICGSLSQCDQWPVREILIEACGTATIILVQISASSFPPKDLSKQIIDLLKGYAGMRAMERMEVASSFLAETFTKQLTESVKLYIKKVPEEEKNSLLRLLVDEHIWIYKENKAFYPYVGGQAAQLLGTLLKTSSNEIRRKFLPDLLFKLARGYVSRDFYKGYPNNDKIAEGSVLIIKEFLRELSLQEQAKVLMELTNGNYHGRSPVLYRTVKNILDAHLRNLTDSDKTEIVTQGLRNKKNSLIDWSVYASLIS